MSAAVVYFEITFQYMRLVLGEILLGVHFIWILIVEEPTNKPSMLTVCFTSP